LRLEGGDDMGKFVEIKNHDGWEYLARVGNRDVVSIICVVDDRLMVIKQKRKPFKDNITIELPAGLVDDQESIYDAAMREFKEETLHEMHQVPMCVAKLASSPGLTNETKYYFYTDNIRRLSHIEIKDLKRDHGDDEIQVCWWDTKCIEQHMLEAQIKGEIVDSSILVALGIHYSSLRNL